MLKIGDKVKMTKRGFKYYANLDKAFNSHSVAGSLHHERFVCAVCEQFAIRGIGTVLRFSSLGYPEIRWENSNSGVKYHYTHYFDKGDIKKLSLLDKLCFKLRKFLC